MFGLVRFTYNIEQDPGNVDIYPSSRLPEDLGFCIERVYQSIEEEGFRIVTDEENATDVLRHLPDEEVLYLILNDLQVFSSIRNKLVVLSN